jgi:Na+/melibiose symporter-like transporter
VLLIWGSIFLAWVVLCLILFFLLYLQVLETPSCRNPGKGCVHKTQSGRTLPRTLRKQELRAPGCSLQCSFFCIVAFRSSVLCYHNRCLTYCIYLERKMCLQDPHVNRTCTYPFFLVYAGELCIISFRIIIIYK